MFGIDSYVETKLKLLSNPPSFHRNLVVAQVGKDVLPVPFPRQKNVVVVPEVSDGSRLLEYPLYQSVPLK
jgi:hypothetical protein